MKTLFSFALMVLISLSAAAQDEGSNTIKVDQPTTQETANPEVTTTVPPSDNGMAPAPVPLKNYANRDLITTAKKPYKVSFFSLASVRTIDAKEGGASVGSYNYLGISTKLDSVSQVGFRYVFYYDTPGTKFNPAKRREEQVTHQTEAGDPYVSYSHYSLWKSENWNLSGSGRLHAPLSRYSQAAKTITQVRAEFFLDRAIGKYSNFNYSVKTDYYVQSQRAMLDEEVPRRNDGSIDWSAVKGTKIASVEHYTEVDWSLHKKYSIKPRLTFEDTWYYGSEENGIDPRHDTDFKTQLGFEYRVLRNLNFTLAIEEKVGLTNLREPVQFGRAENYKYMLLTYASF